MCQTAGGMHNPNCPTGSPKYGENPVTYGRSGILRQLAALTKVVSIFLIGARVLWFVELLSVTPMLTPLLVCFAILAILIHALYGQADHKPWLYNCLASIVYLWGAVVAYDVFFYALGHPADRARVEQTYTIQSGGKRRLIPATLPDFDNIDPADIDMTPTCGSCGPKPPIPAAMQKPVAIATNFVWPVKGKVTARFVVGRNPGINIQVKNGADIRAVDAGNVIYANENETDWGRVVMIQHANGYASVYANNSAVTVKKGDVVKQGAVIAKAGILTGQSTPQLQFRLRHDDLEVDPTLYLRDAVASKTAKL